MAASSVLILIPVVVSVVTILAVLIVYATHKSKPSEMMTLMHRNLAHQRMARLDVIDTKYDEVYHQLKMTQREKILKDALRAQLRLEPERDDLQQALAAAFPAREQPPADEERLSHYNGRL